MTCKDAASLGLSVISAITLAQYWRGRRGWGGGGPEWRPCLTPPRAADQQVEEVLVLRDGPAPLSPCGHDTPRWLPAGRKVTDSGHHSEGPRDETKGPC